MAKIAVISDLHVGSVARSPELNPHVDVPSDGFLNSFEEFTRKYGIDADILIIPGDISNKAHPLEYQLASNVIQRVAASLGVDHANVFPVLGNHDINWALIQAIEGAASFGAGLRFEPVRQVEWLRERLTSGVGATQTDDPYLCINETAEMFLVRYNSAEGDLPHVQPHRGAVRQEHLEILRQRLRSSPPPEDKARIFLTHHHPQIYSDPIPDFPDFSALVNAENLLDVLREFKFDLVIHGHKHVPRFTSSVRAGRHALSILSAGSFSRLIDTAWTGLITNQFHLIETLGRDSRTDYLRGEVRSWAYQPRSWVPSDRQWSGIQYRSPFGTYSSHAELIAAFREHLTPLIALRAVEWNDAIEFIPEIEFADVNVLRNALEIYAAESNAILIFNSDCPSNLVLVRR